MEEHSQEKPSTEKVTAAIGHLIKILVDNLQTDPFSPVREYISNAHDATHNLPNPVIRVWGANGKLHIADNGCGMTHQVIKEAFTRIAGHINNADQFKTIGMFGIGVLSAFIAAEKLEVETRSELDPHGWRLEWGRYAETFTLGKIPKPERGTVAILHLDPGFEDLSHDSELKRYIQRTFGLFTTTIYVGRESSSPVNLNCSWLNELYGKKEKLLTVEESRRVLKPYFPQNFLSAFYLSLDDGTKVILGIPDTESSPYVEKHFVNFFSKGVLVYGNMRSYFPENLSFMVGLIDSPHLKLQISREEIFISDGHFQSVKGLMEQFIIKFLNTLASDQPKVMEDVLRIHKTKLVMHGKACDDLCDLFKDHYKFFTSNGKLKWREILPYAEKKGNDRTIYYTTNAIQVYDNITLGSSLLTVFAFDSEQMVLEQIANCEGVYLKDSAILEDKGDAIEVPEPFRLLSNRLSTHLGQKGVLTIVFVSLPTDKQIPTMFRIRTEAGDTMVADGGGQRPRNSYSVDALMLNVAHPLIGRLAGVQASMPRETFAKVAETLYQIAVLHSPFNEFHFHNAPDIIENLVQFLDFKAGTRHRREDFDNNSSDCFVALPYNDEFNSVWLAAQKVLSGSPYNWKILRADKNMEKPDLLESLCILIKSSRRFLADISGLNPNVLIEVGLMLENYPEGLLIICDDETYPNLPVDLRGKLILKYPTQLRQSQEQLALFLEEEIKKYPGWISVAGFK